MRFIRGINCDRAFPAQVAGPAVEIALVPPGIAPQLSALRAPGRGGHFYFLVKIKIFWVDDKFTLTILTHRVL